MRSHNRKLVASRQVFKKATQRSIMSPGRVELSRSITTLLSAPVDRASLPYQFSQGYLRGPLRSKSQLFRVLYHNQLIYFNPANSYLTSPEQLWLIESIIGTEALHKALFIGKTINNRLIESLFKKAPFAFYLSDDKAYLVSSNDELTQLDFGPLTEISALTALQHFGVAVLERVKEKTVVRL